ncbi:MAG: GNAT family N-acetyltransferase [Paludibacteraceae bacterium]
MRVVRLAQDTELKPFDCQDKDLNDFLLSDAKNYEEALLAVTYLIEEGDEYAAYFSLLNDRILMDEEEKSIWNRVNKLIKNNKRRKSYPAIKIGRLAVSKHYAHKGYGTQILQFIQYLYTQRERFAGCRFITVDAYESALGFYQKCGFKFLTSKDAGQRTRAMYFDLKNIM